jgi:glyoxylase-like metal-dependent hydrolase (beta-lactamase superfamily II)/predicted ester cyclase
MAQEQSATTAATKVQEAAANVRKATASGRSAAKGGPEAVVRRYFKAIDSRDLDAAVGMWAEGGREHVHGQIDVTAPDGVREFIGEMLGALPDMHIEILSTTGQGERCAVQWRLTGTFAGPGQFGGLAPTGDRVTLEGLDLITVRDDLIHSIDAFLDTMAIPRQIGMMPAQGSPGERRLTGAFNLRTRLSSGLAGGEGELIAAGVWVVQGQPGWCNVYLLEDGGRVTLFDAGARTMARAVASAGAKLGGIRRVVLGHSHTDHRGAAPALGAPVLCHPEDVQDAEGSGGFRYWPEGLVGLPTPQRQVHRLLHRYAWDGGPVEIAGTVSEDDEVAGFRVVHIPGHAPGQIALWRDSDRLALTSDCFYTLDMWGRNSSPRVPEDLYNFDTDQARASILKLAALEPAAAWPGHGKPLTGDVRSQLEGAAGRGG